MSSSDHDDESPDSGPAFSTDALTPRGGFMARPGLKPPPRHAVVVRGGEAPISSDIPVARSSFPPPPPELAPISASEKVTQRAIPTPMPPRIASVVFDERHREPYSETSAAPVALESAPPPSDAPTYASIPPQSFAPPARRKSSGWAIAAAAAAGLILGLTSVLATRGASNVTPQPVAAAALPEPVTPIVAAKPEARSPSEQPAASAVSARPSATQKAALPAPAAPPAPAKVGPAGAKQSIF